MNRPSFGKAAGFTLIELMIALVIVAILASIALPAYSSYIDRSRIRTAQADLSGLALNLENRYQRQLAYPALTLDDTSAVEDAFSAWHPAESTFDYSLVSTSDGYTLSATGNSGRLNGCLITLDDGNARSIASCGSYNGDWQ